MPLTEKEIYEFGPFLLDPTERILSCDGTIVSLTPKAFETLLSLVRNPGTHAHEGRAPETNMAGYLLSGCALYQLRPAITPPSTSQITPVTQLAASVSRKSMTAPTSPGAPIRPIG